MRQVSRWPRGEHLTSITLCANSNYFIWAEPNFKSHLDKLTNKVAVSAFQVIFQLVGKKLDKLEGGFWERSD